MLLGVPTMFSAINGSQLLEQYDLSSLRFCISGGAPLPEAVQTTFERLTGCVLVEGYGLTEAGPVCTLNPFAGERRAGSVGLPLPGTLVEIVSLDEPGRRLPLGQRGEICISGPQLMAGYAERPDETADALRDGRLHTGDVGYIDQDGFVYVIDRIKDLILNGGFNVYPRMVEEAILLHPAIEAASVCGVPDRHRGEVVEGVRQARPRRQPQGRGAARLPARQARTLRAAQADRAGRAAAADLARQAVPPGPGRRGAPPPERGRRQRQLRWRRAAPRARTPGARTGRLRCAARSARDRPPPPSPWKYGAFMSLESVTAQIEAQLPQLATLGYKVKFAIQDEGVILVDASRTPATLVARGRRGRLHDPPHRRPPQPADRRPPFPDARLHARPDQGRRLARRRHEARQSPRKLSLNELNHRATIQPSTPNRPAILGNRLARRTAAMRTSGACFILRLAHEWRARCDTSDACFTWARRAIRWINRWRLARASTGISSS